MIETQAEALPRLIATAARDSAAIYRRETEPGEPHVLTGDEETYPFGL